MNTLYENINYLCERKGIKPGRMCNDLGIPRSMISDLKNGRKKSVNAVTLSKIAAFFDVSVDFLLRDEKTAAQEGDGESSKVISFLSSKPKDVLRGILLALEAPEDVLAELDQREQKE